MSLLASLEKVEAELQKVIEEVRSQAAGHQLKQAEPEKVTKETKEAVEDGGFRGDPPVVMQQVLKDRSRNDDPHSLEGIRARQQAAVLRDTDTDERLNLQLSPHFMELSMRSGGALHSSGAHQAVGQLRFSSAQRSSRADLSEGLRQPDCGVIAPYSRLRFSWDLIGTCLIVLDVIILPLSLAWQIDKKLFPIQTSFEAMFLQFLAWTNVSFWPLDVLLNFNTGFHKKGLLIMKRKAIAKNYVHTWLAFDVTVVLIDWTLSLLNTFLEDENQGYLQTLRIARYLRAFRSVRILRIIKSRKMNVTLENWVIGLGQQNLVLAFNVLRMLMSILLTAHLLACTWFGVGVVVSQTGESWIDVAGVGSSTGPVQYLHALSWVVQPPSVPELGVLNTDSLLERIVSIMMVVVTVLVIGSALSLLTGTLQEIRTINNQRSRKRRELRTYLHSQSAPTELVMRIMSFADYKLERHSPVSYDMDLISPLLVAELAVWQRGHLMRGHPLFSLTSEAFPKVFADICGTLHKELYYEGESAFLAGLLAESMYITSHGSFVLYDSHGQEMEKFSNGQNFFSEVALYVDSVMHNCTLTIETFAEVFSLSGKSITSILLHSPICASMFVEYAKEFIAIYSRTAVAHHQSLLNSRAATMSKKNSIASWQVDMKCAKGALQSNSFYMDMNLQDNKVLKNVSLEDVNKRGQKQKKKDGSSSPRMLFLEEDSEGSAEEYHNWPRGSEMHHDMTHHQDTSMPDPANSLVKALLQGQSFTAEQLQEAFVELNPCYGLHTMYSFEQEHEKAVCACFCLAALVTDDYDSFTEPQQETAKLHPSQWQELRNILKWADPTEDVLEAAFFLLAVRSLGKCRAVTRQLPREAQKPEDALLYILENYPNVVPSFARLSVAGQDLVCLAVELQQGFSFPQMLQGENVPANLLQLQDFLRQNGGEKILKFYIVFLLGFLGFLSALQGGTGSLFMTHANAKNINLGLSTVQYVLEKEPGFLYWMYIYQRGVLLNQLARSSYDLAILRLACLCRARNAQDYDQLQSAWNQLGEHQQDVLSTHFLASGIKAPAIVFEFLPLCLERAKANPHVSVLGLLEVLVSLIQATWVTSRSQKITTIDLSNLAAFITSVQNSFIFQSCLQRSKLRLLKHADYQLDLTEVNWNRVSEPPSDLEVVANSVQAILQRQRRTESPTISM